MLSVTLKYNCFVCQVAEKYTFICPNLGKKVNSKFSNNQSFFCNPFCSTVCAHFLLPGYSFFCQLHLNASFSHRICHFTGNKNISAVVCFFGNKGRWFMHIPHTLLITVKTIVCVCAYVSAFCYLLHTKLFILLGPFRGHEVISLVLRSVRTLN